MAGLFASLPAGAEQRPISHWERGTKLSHSCRTEHRETRGKLGSIEHEGRRGLEQLDHWAEKLAEWRLDAEAARAASLTLERQEKKQKGV
jgi:hypothetical protein